MSPPVTCSHEQDVLDALASRRWPSRCDDELRSHVEACAICADLLLVARALLDGRDDEAVSDANLPASLVWWRSQLRAREEATRAAARPLRAAQQIGLACAGVLAIAALGASASSFAESFAMPSISFPSITLPSIDAEAAGQAALAVLAHPGVQFAAGAWLVIAPVLAYIVFARD
jgi:hypothetical protein